jgi:hypothetical protein
MRSIVMRMDQPLAQRLAQLGAAQVEIQRRALDEMRTLGLDAGVSEDLHRSFARLIDDLIRAQKPPAH